MTTLSIDLETYSELDITKVGGYKYAENCEILLFGYAFDDDPVTVIDFTQGDTIPEEIRKALVDTQVRKTAYNAQFERTVLSYKLLSTWPIMLPPEDWFCTMVHGLYLGMPGNLAQLSAVLFPNQEQRKTADGKAQVKYWCTPCKPTKKNGGITRNLPEHDPEGWAKFKEYNRQDVVVERNARKLLERIPFPENEHKLYCLDQRINDFGVKLDMDLVRNAIECDQLNKADMEEDARALTGIINVNSGPQMIDWLQRMTGLEITSLDKAHVKELLETVKDPLTKEVLRLRQQMSKTSVKKYQAMNAAVCSDGRVRGLLQFYGANRTGRWAGRLVQVQNLPKNFLKDLELARNLLKDNDYDLIELLFGSTQNVLSQLIRTAFVAKEGTRLVISDFSAIEARVIAWLAGEQWRLDVFNSHGAIYEASASTMFHVPLERIVKGNPEYDQIRPKGKVAELALGYQGGPKALIAMGALDMGLTEDELPEIVQAWRTASPAIVKLWYDVEAAAKKAVQKQTSVKLGEYLTFTYKYGILFVTLPSGRQLSYVRPQVKETETKVGLKMQLSYEGMNQETKQWQRIATYGGKMTENIIQAIARDCLALSMLRLEDTGYTTGMHVHDEIIAEMPLGVGSLEEMNEILSLPIPWAPGLPLKGAGFETQFYKKDD